MEKKVDLEHFYEIKTNNGYEPDYDKIRNSEIKDMLIFLANKKSISCKLFYPIFNYYGIRLNNHMSNELILIGQYLCNMHIDYSDIPERQIPFNRAECNAAIEEIRSYFKVDDNIKVKKR